MVCGNELGNWEEEPQLLPQGWQNISVETFPSFVEGKSDKTGRALLDLQDPVNIINTLQYNIKTLIMKYLTI